MAKAEVKTKATQASPAKFIAGLPDARRRDEARALDAIYRRVTGLEPKMWGPSIIGYGSYRYKYASGRAGEICRAGFSPRTPLRTQDSGPFTAFANAATTKSGTNAMSIPVMISGVAYCSDICFDDSR